MTHPKLMAIVVALMSGSALTADRTTVYTVDLSSAHTQMVDVTISVDAVETETVDFLLPVWRPGRYVVLDPATTVRDVTASDGARRLAVDKTDKTTWRVATDGATRVDLRYRIYANSLGDRTRHADDSHAFLSGSAVFMYVPERRADPVEVDVIAPDAWEIATGLEPHPTRPRCVVAPDYDVLVDSPLEIGLHDRIMFEVDGVPHEIVIWPPNPADYDDDEMIDDFSTIVRACRDVFGDLPFRRYVFLMHVGAGAGGGTEHLNSTIMQTARASLEDSGRYKRFLGLVAHEFFHTWNVKQLRPADLIPYDYQRENYTVLLWVAEGTTSYYDELLLARTEIIDEKRYFEMIGSAIDSLRRRPGATVQSLRSSSFDAWVKYNRNTADDVNSTVSFYSKGALVSLLLDLEILRRTDGAASLDDVLRTLYERHPLDSGGYTEDDLRRVAEEISGGGDLGPFFDLYVNGTEELPLEALLPTVGLELILEPNEEDDEDDDESTDDDTDFEADTEEDAETVPIRPYLGLDLRESGGRTTVRSVRADGPAYDAGIIAGDEIMALNGRRLGSNDLQKRLDDLEPTATITLHLFRRDELREVRVTLEGRPDGTWTVQRLADVTDTQKRAYERWMGRPWEEPETDEDQGAGD